MAMMTPVISLTPRQLGEHKMTADEMLARMREQGYVDQASARLRSKLYRLLKQRGIRFRSEVIGHLPYPEHTASFGPFAGLKSMVYLCRQIHHKRILGQHVENMCQESELYPFEPMRAAFLPHLTMGERIDIVKTAWGDPRDWSKWDPFSRAGMVRNVVRIHLLRGAQ